MTKQIFKWLEQCSNCGSDNVSVETSRKDNRVNMDDVVTCSCGNTGYIDVWEGSAFVCWDELSKDEINYNELKIRYDKAIECLMESNYGDENYLRKRGVIK